MGKFRTLIAILGVAIGCVAKLFVITRPHSGGLATDLLSQPYHQYSHASYTVPLILKGSVLDASGRLPGVNVQSWAATEGTDGVTFTGDGRNSHSAGLRHSFSQQQLSKRNVVAQKPKGYDSEVHRQEALNSKLKAQLENAEKEIAATIAQTKSISQPRASHTAKAVSNPFGVLARSTSSNELVDGVLSSSTLGAAAGDDKLSYATGVLARTAADSVNRDGPLAVSPAQGMEGLGLLGRAAAGKENVRGALASVPASKELEDVDSKTAGGALEEVQNNDGEIGGALSAVKGDEMSNGVLSSVSSLPGPRQGILSRVAGSSSSGSLSATGGNEMVSGVLSSVHEVAEMDAPTSAAIVNGALGALPADSQGEVDGELARVAAAADGRDGPLSSLPHSQKDEEGSLLQLHNRAGLVDGDLAASAPSGKSASGVLAELQIPAAQESAQAAGSLSGLASTGPREGFLQGLRGSEPGSGSLGSFSESAAERDGSLSGLPRAAANTAGTLSQVKTSAADRDGFFSGIHDSESSGGVLASVHESDGERDGSLSQVAGKGVGGSLAALQKAGAQSSGDGVLSQVQGDAENAGGALTAVAAGKGGPDGEIGVLGRARQESDAGGVLSAVEAQRRAWVAKQVRLHASGGQKAAARGRAVSIRRMEKWDKVVKELSKVEEGQAARVRAAVTIAAATSPASQLVHASRAEPARARKPLSSLSAKGTAASTPKTPHHVVLAHHANKVGMGKKLPHLGVPREIATSETSGAYRQLEAEAEEGGKEEGSKEGGGKKAEPDIWYDNSDIGWVKRKWTALGWVLFAVFGPAATLAVSALVFSVAGPVAATCTLVVMASMDVCSYYYSWYII
eukprot:CAMPEP_0113712768 /NCGR_PEP_ID=MMETSP0038_2-20120614/31584_1 /TAXON_ID=2898 /ORGANISM="Cryptomonas paramecium" /LENGTH=852 /DNA_ID=CAMNT_0000639349 /DNA_START=15 /DNA_END=2573 /DNA_ORIENTATION=- /assembly_acc=CAM_ASM_000170